MLALCGAWRRRGEKAALETIERSLGFKVERVS